MVLMVFLRNYPEEQSVADDKLPGSVYAVVRCVWSTEIQPECVGKTFFSGGH